MASKGCLLLIVGFACLWCHVVGQLTWHVIGNSTDDPYWPAPRRDAAIGYNGVRNQLILFGGRGFQTSDGPVLKDTWIYEISLGKWRQLDLDSGPPARHSFVSGVSGRHFYIATGQGANNVFHDDIWRFDFAAEEWTKLPAHQNPPEYTRQEWTIRMRDGVSPRFRYGAGGGIFANASRFYVSMGFAADRFADTLSYSVHDMGWYSDYPDRGPYNPSYPHARCLHASVMLSAYEMLIFGGCLSGGGTGGPCPSSDSWIYNGKRSEWQQLKYCAAARRYASLAMLPMKNGERRAVLYGGDVDGRQVIMTDTPDADEVAVLNPESRSWARRRTVGDVPSWRMSVAMTTASNGIYMFGGYDGENDRGSNALYLLSGDSESADSAPSAGDCAPPFVNFVMLHGIFMAIGWGFCLPAGVFVARYLRRRDPLWFRLHLVLQITGLILAIAGFVCAVISVVFDHFRFTHGIIGLVVTILGLQQPINALFRPHPPRDGAPRRLARVCWEFSHHLLGRSALLLALVNISLGVFLAVAHRAIWIAWFVYLSAVVLLFVVAETLAHYVTGVPPGGQPLSNSLRKYAVQNRPPSAGSDAGMTLDECYTNDAVCL